MDPGLIAATTMSTGMAAAAAAAEDRRRKMEEVSLTAYNQKELDENWEFKILHTARGAFKDPQRLRAVLDEEAQAGWGLVEKFDNSRVRLKRSPDARRNDLSLGFDPWRSYVGPQNSERNSKFIALIVCLLLAVAGVLLAVLISFVGPPG